MDVPDSFASAEEAEVFLGSLSDDDRALLGKVVQASLYPSEAAGLTLPEYWLTARLLFEELKGVSGHNCYELTRNRLLVVLGGPTVQWRRWPGAAVNHLALGLALSVTRDLWRVLLSPFQVVATIPQEWRPTVLAAAGNLGLVAALALPNAVLGVPGRS